MPWQLASHISDARPSVHRSLHSVYVTILAESSIKIAIVAHVNRPLVIDLLIFFLLNFYVVIVILTDFEIHLIMLTHTHTKFQLSNLACACLFMHFCLYIHFYRFLFQPFLICLGNWSFLGFGQLSGPSGNCQLEVCFKLTSRKKTIYFVLIPDNRDNKHVKMFACPFGQ